MKLNHQLEIFNDLCKIFLSRASVFKLYPNKHPVHQLSPLYGRLFVSTYMHYRSGRWWCYRHLETPTRVCGSDRAGWCGLPAVGLGTHYVCPCPGHTPVAHRYAASCMSASICICFSENPSKLTRNPTFVYSFCLHSPFHDNAAAERCIWGHWTVTAWAKAATKRHRQNTYLLVFKKCIGYMLHKSS